MTDVSAFYTAKTGATTPAAVTGPGVATTPSAGIGGFLDLLLAQILPSNTNKTINADNTGESSLGNTNIPVVDNINNIESDLSSITESSAKAETSLVNPALAVLLNNIEPGTIDAAGTENVLKTAPVLPTISPESSAPLPNNAEETSPPITSGEDFVMLPPDLDTNGNGDLAMIDPDGNAISAVPAPISPPTPKNNIQPNSAQLNSIASGLTTPTTTVKTSDKDTGKNDRPTTLLDAILQGVKAANDTSTSYQPNLTPAKDAYQALHTPTAKPSVAAPLSVADDIGDTNIMASLDVGNLIGDRALPIVQNTLSGHVAITGSTHATPAQQQAMVNAVAAVLQQQAQSRDTRSLTVQINPPELGKLQVKMTYGRDKSVKADILVEKSDTFNLLQKDSETLKDALNNAGLQADDGSLNFTLADHGTFTDTRQDPSSTSTINNSQSDTEVSVIEIKASEEWSVDPKTGITRYNIYV